jgi:hypothetical protein
MRPWTVIIIALAALVAIVPVARADVSAVVVYGQAKEHERVVVATAVKQAVLDSSWSVSETTFVPSEVDGIVVCLDLDRPWPCVEPTASGKGVQRLVVVHVEHKGKAVLVTGQVILQSEAVPVIEQRHCEPCFEANLDLSARDMTKVLLRRTSAAQGKTAIELRTVPPGASIAIDGKLVGASDATLPISAGPHQVQLQRSGYRTESRSITVAQGQTYKLAVALTPDGGGGARFPLVPALIAGAGAIALVGGTIYSFTADSPSSFEQPRYLYSGPAIGLAAAGGAALGIGIYLWFRAPREAASRSAPTASLRPGGGVFGWTTSF